MSTNTSRRSLLRWAALGGAVTACRHVGRGEGPFSLAYDKPSVPGAGAYGTFEERWVNSSCAQCPAGCGIRVRVVEGRAVRIEGNPENPLNRGGIGPRGLSGLQALYDADRLKGPMGRDDAGALVPISWKDALDRLTARLHAIPPEQLLVWSGAERGMMLELFARFAQAFGTPKFHAGTRPALLEQAMEEAYGVRTLPAFEWGDAHYVLSLEAGLLEDTCQAVWFARAAAELRRGKGVRAKIVHAGPVYDLSAHNADEWIRIAPGTSGALALGIAHVLVKQGRIAPDPGAGLDAFVAALEPWDPMTVSNTTGAPPSKIEAIATEMADAGVAFAIVDDRSLAYSNGLQTAHAALSLDALLGANVGVASPPPYAEWPALTAPAQDAPPPITPESFAGVEVALLHRVNPVWARAEPAKWKQALMNVPMVVSFSPFLDETSAEVADLVLPDHTYLERWEDAHPAPGTGRLVAGVRRPVVEPMHDTRATGDVLITIAAAIDRLAPAFPWPSFADAMEARLKGLYAAQRGSIQARGEDEFLDQLYENGFWADVDAPLDPVTFRFQPGWDPPSWQGEPGPYPLQLVAYRPLGYAEGSGANQPWLRMLESRPYQRAYTTPVTVHPDDAPDVSDGDLVTISSAYGSITVPVRLDPLTQPGVIAVPFGGGHTAFGRWAVGVGANVNEVLASGAVCATRVRLERSRS